MGSATTLKLAELREELDRTTWANEVIAQEYEAVIVSFWDRLRLAPMEDRFKVAASLPMERVSLGPLSGSGRNFDLGIQAIRFTRRQNEDPVFLAPENWKRWLEGIQRKGFQIAQSEWHHGEFVPESPSERPDQVVAARSLVSFEIHLLRPGETPEATIVKGEVEIVWKLRRNGDKPEMGSLRVLHATVVKREGGAPL
ncbi:MAG: hypothetical protein O3C21_02925 [Verrucomicrobia bacterium]|nr:hypothetical protein [Verrucomicrobiota bacterium]